MQRRSRGATGLVVGLWALGCGGAGEGAGDEASGSESGGIELDGAASEGADGPKLDVPHGDDPGPGGCTPTGPEGFSYIWIANSDEGTVSKTDTGPAQVIEKIRLPKAA